MWLNKPLAFARRAGDYVASLDRPRLDARIATASRFPVAVLAAPAGAGKSLAVQRYLMRSGPGAVYLSAHQSALSEQLRGLRGADSSKAQIVVLEDADRAFADAATARAVTDAIFALAQCRWILIVRDPAAIPLETWLTGRICDEPIGAADLRFDLAEALLIAERFGIAASEAERLWHESAGNPLQFNALCIAPRYRDAVNAVWDRATDDAREELGLLSVLPRSATVGELAPELRAMLRSGIVLGTDAAGNVQMHEAAAAIVRERIGAEALEAVRESAASRCALDRRYECVPELLEGCNSEAVRDFLERFGFDMIEQGWTEEVFALLARARACDDPMSPLILALHALCESSFGRRDLASSWFAKAREAAQGTDAEAIVAYRYFIEALRLGQTGVAKLLEPYLQRDDIPAHLAALILSAWSIACVTEQRFEEATQGVARALQIVENDVDAETRATVFQHAAWIAFFAGDLEQARKYAPLAAREAEAARLFGVAARALSVEYNIAYDLEHDPIRSAEIIERIHSCGVRSRNGQVVVYALLGKIDLASERGDARALAQLESALLASEFDYSDPACGETLVAAKASIAAASGHFSTACTLLTSVGEPQIGADRRVFRNAEVALYAAACGRETEARTALEAAIAAVAEAGGAASRRVLHAKANIALAQVLLGEDAGPFVADLQRVADNPEVAARLKFYVDAVLAVLERWSGERNHRQLFDSLVALEAGGLGGYGAMLAALPACAPEWEMSA